MSAAEDLIADLPDFVKSPPVECVVFGWGVNEDGQLGYESEDCASTPRVVESLLGYKLRGRELGRNPLIAGSRNTLAISQDGMVWSWGWNDRGTLGKGHKSNDKAQRHTAALKTASIVQAAIGGWHCLAVDTHGKVYAWGGNEYMQCAVDSSTRDVLSPTPVVPRLSVQQVACGGMHSLALTKDGDVWTWGEPWGDFSMSQEKTPRCVRQTHDTIMIACGAFHNMALDENGHIFTWGLNDYGQLGNGGTNYTTIPSQVVDLDDTEVVDIAAGGWHSVAVTKQGALYAWGRGEYGRLGLGDTSGSSRLRPQRVPKLGDHCIVQASAGGTHTCCLSSEGVGFIWGRGSFGRLGKKDSLKDRYVPEEIELPGGGQRWRILAIACGGRHSLCLALPSHNEVSGGVSTDGSRGDDEGSDQMNDNFRSLPATNGQPPDHTEAQHPGMTGGATLFAGIDHEDDD